MIHVLKLFFIYRFSCVVSNICRRIPLNRYLKYLSTYTRDPFFNPKRYRRWLN